MTACRLLTIPAIVAVAACTLVGYPSGAPAWPAPVSPASAPTTEPTSGKPASPTGADTSRADTTGAETRAPADFRRDRPPDSLGVNLDTISDAVPREEPLSKYGNQSEYEAFGSTYRTLATSEGYEEEGLASWYGEEFQGRRTSSGEPYDLYAMTAAHRTLPLPSYVEVTNLENGRTVVVRVNDRGPFRSNRVIDVSYAAGHRLGLLANGTARVRVRALQPPGQ